MNEFVPVDTELLTLIAGCLLALGLILVAESMPKGYRVLVRLIGFGVLVGVVVYEYLN